MKPEFEKNGFDYIRYFAAFSVMMLHYTGYALIRSNQAAAVMRGIRKVALFFPGVVILFALSGFLIAASYEHSRDVKEFFRKRVLRMYPELWLCTLVNLAVVCILVPGMLDAGIFVWLGTQIFGIANTPSCLDTFATGSINGALWTIFTEVQLYIIFGLVYRILKKLNTFFWIVLLSVLVAVNLLCASVAAEMGGIAAKLIERTFLPYALWFMIGVFCYCKRQNLLPFLEKAFVPILLSYVVVRWQEITLPGYYADIFTSIVLPFLVIGGGYCLPKHRVKCDLTYGMFLYHWIILNIIIYFDFMNCVAWYVLLPLFVLITLLAAWLSKRSVALITKRFL